MEHSSDGLGNTAITHDIPCEVCGSYVWVDWVLKPDTLFNQYCSGGNGYLCFPCFCRKVDNESK